MASKITSSPATGEPVTQTELKRPLMPHKLLEAAIDGNETNLKKFLGLNDKEQDHHPHTKISVEDVTPVEPSNCLRISTRGNALDVNSDDEEAFVEDETPMEPSDCLRSITGMGNTILHVLSANGHEKLVSIICFQDSSWLNANSLPNDSSLLKVHNVRKETPLHHAARFGHENIILKLTEHAKSKFSEVGLKELLRQKNFLGETALHEAARHGQRAVVSTLMEEDLELAGMVNDDYVSPLYLATARGSLDMVQNIVAKILNHEITCTPAFYSGPRKQTALHAAVLQDQELTKDLLQLYSEPLGKGKDETGRTPFHLVAATGNHKIAKLLLGKDRSLAYIQDSDGSFPMHTAVRMGHIEMIVLLLQRCLDSGELLDGNGRNFLHIAIEAKKSNVIFKLLKDSKKELPISYWKKMLNTMANTMDNKGNTPLHLAAEHGYNDVMLSLLENNKLDLTLENKETLTAFDLSVIQFRKSARTTQRRDILGEFYIQKRGARFSTGWFQHYNNDKENDQMSEKKLEAPMRIDQMSEAELIRSTNDDHISTMDARGAKTKSSESLVAKAQLVGLGSVLIATVTFAAAFTLPGGTNQDTGTPILGKKKFLFNAFIFTDFFAFCFSFMSTMLLIYSSRVDNSDRMSFYIDLSLAFFTFAAQYMVMALGLGLHLVLTPIGQSGILVLTLSVTLAVGSNLVILVQECMRLGYFGHFGRFSVQSKILKHIPDVASDVSPQNIKVVNVLLNFMFRAIYFIFPFMFAYISQIDLGIYTMSH